MVLSSGAKAWMGLATYVVVADSYLIWKQEKTMSAVFGESLEHPAKKWPVLLVWGFLSNHLHRSVLPEISSKVDPLQNGLHVGERLWYHFFGESKSKSN